MGDGQADKRTEANDNEYIMCSVCSVLQHAARSTCAVCDSSLPDLLPMGCRSSEEAEDLAQSPACPVQARSGKPFPLPRGGEVSTAARSLETHISQASQAVREAQSGP